MGHVPYKKGFITITVERAYLERIIAGGVKAAINDHGPITKEFCNSVSKRVIGQLISISERQRKQKELERG